MSTDAASSRREQSAAMPSPCDDERLLNSVLAIADELTDHGFVLRYRTDETRMKELT
jgi:hypothetical protein